jgi:hypothetical protein
MRSVALPCLLVVLVVSSSVACASAVAVERGYDGHIVVGRPIEPEAYASYVRGVLAELDGLGTEAAVAYREVLRVDPLSVEAWTRLGALECARNPHDRAARDALAKATDLDPTYRPGQEESVRCSVSRGSSVAGAQERRDDRTNVVARSVAGDQPADGWNAVLAWAESRHDASLVGYAHARLVRLGASQRRRAVAVAERLAGQGELGVARTLAGAIVDADGSPLTDADAARVGRLAVDDAIARRDIGLTRARATRARIRLDEVAARALLGARPDIARELALERVRAEPESPGARMVLGCVEGGDLLEVADALREPRESVSAEVLVAFGTALARAIPPAEARAVLGRIQYSDPTSGDGLVVRQATELAALGVLSARRLPPDGLVELAARYGISPPATWDAAALDSRHRYLALAMSRPEASETRQLGELLGGTAARDPIIAAGAAWVSLATGSATASTDARALLARNAADPLLASVALRLAERAGDDQALAQARASLMR